MSMSDGVSYFSRFFLKFVEIIAAGLATAVSGYLIAHLGSFMSPPAATNVQVDAPASAISTKVPPQSSSAAPIAAGETHSVPARDPETLAKPAQPMREAAKPSRAAPPARRTRSDSAVAERRREEKSVEAQVRAALASVDAARPAPLEATRHLPDAPPPAALPSSPAVGEPRGVKIGEPRGTDAAPSAAVPRAAVPPAVEAVPPPVAPAAPPSEIAAPAPPATEREGVLSTLAQIPQWLRPAPAQPSDDVLRPPMPVGQ